jgi:hypothetical protein
MAAPQISGSSPQPTSYGSQPVVVSSAPQKTTHPHAPKKPKKPGKGSKAPASGDPYQTGLNFDYNSPLTAGLLKKYVNAAVKLKYGTEEKNLQNTQKQIPGWYASYKQDLSNALQGTQAAYGAVGSALGQQAASAPDTQLQGDAAAYGNLVKTQGLMSSERYRELGNVAGQDQIVRMDKVRQALKDLQAEKGAYRVDQAHQAIDAERKYGLESAAFNLDQYQAQTGAANDAAKIESDAATSAAKIKADKQKANNAVNKWGFTNKEWTSMDPGQRQTVIKQQSEYGKGVGKGGLSPSEVRARKKQSGQVESKLQDAIGFAASLKKQYEKQGLKGAKLRDAIGSALTNGQYIGETKVDPLSGQKVTSYGGKPIDNIFASSALDYVLTGDHHVSGRNRARLRHQGLLRSSAKTYRPKGKRPSKQDYNSSVNGSPGSDRAQG